MFNSIPTTTPEEEKIINKKISDKRNNTFTNKSLNYLTEKINITKFTNIKPKRKIVERNQKWFSKFVDGRLK